MQEIQITKDSKMKDKIFEIKPFKEIKVLRMMDIRIENSKITKCFSEIEKLDVLNIEKFVV